MQNRFRIFSCKAWLVTAVCLGLCGTSGQIAYAGGDSWQNIELPAVTAKTGLRFVSRTFRYPDYYAGVATAMEAVFTPICTPFQSSETCIKQGGYGECVQYDANCNRFNPLAVSGIHASSNAEDTGGVIKDPCHVTINVSNMRNIIKKKHAALAAQGYANKRKMLMLAIRTLERNTKASYFHDCKLSYVGIANHPQLEKGPLPKVFNPIVDRCDQKTQSSAKVAQRLGLRAQRSYDRGRYLTARSQIRRALRADCTSVESWLTSAAIFSKNDEIFVSQAAMLRAYKIDAKRALTYYEKQPPFDRDKSFTGNVNTGTAFSQRYAQHSATRCPGTGKQDIPIASVKREGKQCIATLSRPVAGSRRLSTTPFPMYIDEIRYRNIRIVDRAKIQVPKIKGAGSDPCRKRMAGFISVRYRPLRGDACTLGIVDITHN